MAAEMTPRRRTAMKVNENGEPCLPFIGLITGMGGRQLSMMDDVDKSSTQRWRQVAHCGFNLKPYRILAMDFFYQTIRK
jgi:hypothetical protein